MPDLRAVNQLRTRLKQNPWTLLVSLPKNDPALAQAALRAGAKGLKVHINVEHFASGTRFGSFEEEKSALAEIVGLAHEYGANVGVVPGANGTFATEAEFAALAQIGIDYFDAYPGDTPAWALTQKHLDVMLAAYHGVDLDEFSTFEELGMTLCEASVLPHEEYGKPLTALDLARYSYLDVVLDVPIIIPSQKKVVPSDTEALIRTGCKGLLIGAIVTGREVESLEAAVKAFAAVS